MSKRFKVFVVSLALASMASVRCTPKQKTDTIKVVDTVQMRVDQVKQIVAACSLEVPPAPPHAFLVDPLNCFTGCSDEDRQALATWLGKMIVWTQDALECRGVVKDVAGTF